ncbi:hypothetical protein N493_19195 (plasmid) [Clostridium botulinum B2 433]|uniref:hypothetical protein n=1 Tax=Clostridium botulinum TaxID=1491 RepID=UPI0007E0E2EB|nr:hypothetical protein [Clostridium botulinum]KEI84032.1 hypothetical protein N493_19195 [Clostridium botulinum B2 433]
MELKLSCFKCGFTKFEYEPIKCLKVDNNYYLMHEDVKEQQMKCQRCGLRDYIENFVIVIK